MYVSREPGQMDSRVSFSSVNVTTRIETLETWIWTLSR